MNRGKGAITQGWGNESLRNLSAGMTCPELARPHKRAAWCFKSRSKAMAGRTTSPRRRGSGAASLGRLKSGDSQPGLVSWERGSPFSSAWTSTGVDGTKGRSARWWVKARASVPDRERRLVSKSSPPRNASISPKQARMPFRARRLHPGSSSAGSTGKEEALRMRRYSSMTGREKSRTACSSRRRNESRCPACASSNEILSPSGVAMIVIVKASKF